MITTVLCYSATSGSSVADYGKPCRVDMGNVGLMDNRQGLVVDVKITEATGTSERDAALDMLQPIFP